VQQIKNDEQQRKDQVIPDEIVAQLEAEAGRASRHRQAVVAAVGLHRHEHVVHHLREGERDHDEVHAARAQRDRADQQRRERRHQDGRRPRDPQAAHALGGKDAHHVGAGAEERGVAEAHHAAVAQHQVQARRRHGIDQNAGGEGDVEVLVERMHDQRKEQNQNERNFLHPRAGNNPCGRKNSTAAIST
jgi:hypothetical protein